MAIIRALLSHEEDGYHLITVDENGTLASYGPFLSLEIDKVIQDSIIRSHEERERWIDRMFPTMSREDPLRPKF